MRPTPLNVRVWGVLLAVLLNVSVAQAQSASFMPDRVVSALMENDVIAGTDRDYTNGLRLSVLARNGTQMGLSGAIARRLL